MNSQIEHEAKRLYHHFFGRSGDWKTAQADVTRFYLWLARKTI
jgi:hypothetical protein